MHHQAKNAAYLVHVYLVNGLVEVDGEADNAKEALAKALEQAKTATPTEADCRFVAVIPEIRHAIL